MAITFTQAEAQETLEEAVAYLMEKAATKFPIPAGQQHPAIQAERLRWIVLHKITDIEAEEFQQRVAP